MAFDLNSAIPVRKREDGLLEKNTFDIPTARPVEQEISMDRNPRYSIPADKDRATVELMYKESGQEVPFGTKVEWTLTSAPAKLITSNILGTIASGGMIPFYNIAKGIANASSPNSDIGKMIFDSALKGLAENQDIENLGGAAAKAYPELPWEITGSMGALAEVLMFMPRVATKAGEFLTKDKQFTIALNNARQSPKWGDYIGMVAKKVNQPIEIVDQALYNTLWNIRGEANYFKILNSNLKKSTGIDIFSNVGSIPLKRTKVGQIVEYVNQQGIKEVGKIKEIVGDRHIIELGNSEVVASLSQLSMPEAIKQPKIKPTEAQGDAISSKEDILAISTSQAQIEGAKPPVKPPEIAISSEPNPEEPIKSIIKNIEISPETQTKLESDIISIQPKLEEIKGKPLTHKEVLEAAKSSNLLKDIVTRTESKEAEAALVRTEQHLAALAEETGISKEFMENLKVVKSFATNAARNLGARRIIAKPEIYNIKSNIINKLTDLGKTIEEIELAAKGVNFNNQDEVTAFYRKFIKPNLSELISEYRYINLLSSPKTHIVNIVSNALQVSGMAPATKLISGIIDPVASKLFGVERSHYIKEVPAYVRGALSSISDASQKAFSALKGISFVERPDVKHIPTGAKILKPFRFIPQALEASDVFFRTMAYQGELEAQLSKGVELEKAKEIATKKASYIVFRKALDPIRMVKGKAVIPDQGALLGAIDNMTSLFYKSRNLPIFGKAISWFAPFVQTPMEIGKQMLEYSALGGTTIPGAKDKVEQLSKSLLGSIITAIAAGIILNQDSTAEEPTGSKEKELFRATGRIPWAIKFGNTWVSINRLGPIGFPVAMALSAKHYFKQNPAAATDTNMQKAAKVIGGFGEYFAAQSYVESLGDLLDLAKNAPGALSKLISNIPSQIIPLSSFQRWVNSYFIDPVFRKAEKGLSIETIIDNAKKSIVFATKEMEPYLDLNEQPSKRNMPLLNAISPVVFSKANNEFEGEYQDYLEKRREDLIEKQELGEKSYGKRKSNIRN